MGYLIYYGLWLAFSFALANPWLLLGLAALLVVQRWLPDPVVYLATSRRMRELRAQVEINRANVTARRDLATLYLDRRRARAALALIDEALERTPEEASLHLLRGKALLRLSRFDDALAEVGRAVELDATLGRGEPFELAGDAHLAMGRLEEAEHAYEQCVEENQSRVGVRAKLAKVRRARGDAEGARRARVEAITTFAQLPAYLRRRELGVYLVLRLRHLVD